MQFQNDSDIKFELNKKIFAFIPAESGTFWHGPIRAPMKANGYLLGLENLSRMLKPQGKLYLSVPIGPQRTEFNANRVFSLGYLLKCLPGGFDVVSFSYIGDGGDLHEAVPLKAEGIASNCGCTFWLGILESTKQ
jgi:hypothetical protein